jgi:hypothetical protein
MSMGGIFDFRTESKNYVYTTTNTNTDSFNRSSSSSSVLDNVGNVTVNPASADSVLDKYLPIVAIGFLVIGILKGGGK